jgi:hypothetical protein
MQVPAPTFLQTRSLLLLRENQLAHPAPGTASPASSQIALYGNTSGVGSSSGGPSGGGGGGGGRWQKKKKNRGGASATDPHDNSSTPLGPWICFNPYTGQARQMQPTWRPSGGQLPPPGGPGLLGPRPATAHRPSTWVPLGQQAYTTPLAPLHGQAFGTNPPPPTTLFVPSDPAPQGHGAPAWDSSALIAALNSSVGASPTGSSTTGTWVMDSGATSHMVSDPGILPSPSQLSPPSYGYNGSSSDGPSVKIYFTTNPLY